MGIVYHKEWLEFNRQSTKEQQNKNPWKWSFSNCTFVLKTFACTSKPVYTSIYYFFIKMA